MLLFLFPLRRNAPHSMIFSGFDIFFLQWFSRVLSERLSPSAPPPFLDLIHASWAFLFLSLHDFDTPFPQRTRDFLILRLFSPVFESPLLTHEAPNRVFPFNGLGHFPQIVDGPSRFLPLYDSYPFCYGTVLPSTRPLPPSFRNWGRNFQIPLSVDAALCCRSEFSDFLWRDDLHLLDISPKGFLTPFFKRHSLPVFGLPRILLHALLVRPIPTLVSHVRLRPFFFLFCQLLSVSTPLKITWTPSFPFL